MTNNDTKRGVYAIVILLLFALLPVFKVSSLVDFTLVPRQLLGVVGSLVLVLLLFFSKAKKELPINAVGLSFLAFILMNFVSVTAAVNPVESWATISRYLLMFSFFLILTYLLHHKLVHAKHLIQSVIVFGAIAAILTVFELLGALGSGEFFSDIYAVKATFAHKNLLSSALMLSLPFAIMGVGTMDKLWKRGSLILLFLLIIEIFVLRTRGAWLSILISTVCCSLLFVILKNRTKLEVSFPARTVGIGVGLAVVLVAALFSASGIQESVTDTTNLDKRVIFWQNSLEMTKEHPVTGVGAGNWKINFPKYGLDGLDYNVIQGITHVQRPHNDYLWVLTESGIPGLLAFLGIFFFGFRQLLLNFSKGMSKEDFAIDMALAFGLIAYMVFSLTDFPLERTSHNLICVTLIALVFRKGIQSSLFSLKFNLWALPLLAGLVFSLVVAANRWQGEKHSVDVLKANASRNAQRIIPKAEDALNQFYNMDNFANPVYYYSSLGKLVLQQPDNALQDAMLAYEIAPYNIITLSQIGNVYKVKENFDEAIRYYDLATDISPMFESGRFSKSEIYLNQKKHVEAFEQLMGVNPYTKDPRLGQQLPYTLQELYKKRNQHGRFKSMMSFMDGKRLKSQEDYLKVYRDFVVSSRESQAGQ